jgi:hypothetical protein
VSGSSSKPFSCPKCGSTRVRPSARRSRREKLLRFVGVRFYRCRDCRHRSSRRGSMPSDDPGRRARLKALAREERRRKGTGAERALLALVVLVTALALSGWICIDGHP